jgi:hypothetical protein
MSRPDRTTAAGRAYLDLQNRARREQRGTQELLTMYVVERWLARLAISAHVDDFILKGGMLLAAFGARRPTVDVDALARNLSADQESVISRVAEIAAIEIPDDGMEYLVDTVRASTIRDDALYAGVRVVMEVRIATAQVKLQLDVNFGDPVTPAPRTVDLPSYRTSRLCPERNVRHLPPTPRTHGERLPESFAEVVDAVIAFADPLVDGSAYDRWDHEGRRWGA